ncbi:MAG: flagellar basal body rod protein FlgB [Deltaproteobacteria bacterium]|jgi:flagellar basal-body rod protein FlgB|nr:flagellar basal body rod protein FlgB [Deltaproteobacteria bacterium]
MSSSHLFSETISYLERSLNLRSKRHRVLSANIANIDTPNYKAFDLVLEDEFKRPPGSAGNIELKRTHSGHLPVEKKALDRVTLKRSEGPEFSLRGDGNTVDLDKTMGDMAENTLLFKTAAQIISKKFQGLKEVIKGGK